GTHDGRAEAQQHAAFEALGRAGEDQEVAITGRAEGRAIAIGMLMQNVVADADVRRNRYGTAVARGEHAQILPRIGAFHDAPARVLTESQAASGSLAHPVVQLAGFVP